MATINYTSNSGNRGGYCFCNKMMPLPSSLLLVATILAMSLHQVTARTWLEIVEPDAMYKVDRVGYKRITVSEFNPFRYTQSPTISPAPSDAPTQMPSVSPTKMPTTSPTMNPTATPTMFPTAPPTTDFYVKEPKDPDRGTYYRIIEHSMRIFANSR